MSRGSRTLTAPRRFAALGVLAALLIAMPSVAAPPTTTGAPDFAVLIDPLEALAVIYSGVVKVRPQFQWAFSRYVALEASLVFTHASSRFKRVDQDVTGGGGQLGLRFMLDWLSGPYIACRAGPLGLKGGGQTMAIMLVEVELGWSWAPRNKGLIMNGGLGYQGYNPLDKESRLHYVTAHTFLVNYSIGYAW